MNNWCKSKKLNISKAAAKVAKVFYSVNSAVSISSIPRAPTPSSHHLNRSDSSEILNVKARCADLKVALTFNICSAVSK